ncbi:MAG: c-type cytochrome [Cyanobacteria bacterium J06642_2]
MKRIVSVVAAISIAVTFFMGMPALASADLDVGKKVFTSNCSSCHLGGKNVIMAQKNLKIDALEKYLTNFGDAHDAGAIAYQVTNGKNAMPAFGGRLNTDEIESVAAYVIAQAEADWKS